MPIAPDEKIDWFRIIIDIERSGYSHRDIAAAIGAASKSSIPYYKAGGTPLYDAGDRLVALWCEVKGIGQENVPRVKRNSYLA